VENGKEHPRVLIEEWFPSKIIGSISRREKIGNSAPITHLQLWWARRPLTVSRAAIISSLLEPKDKELFNQLLLIDNDKKDIFSSEVNKNIINNMKSRIFSIWKKEAITILDPMAGGGSIPFESYRLGFRTICNDLNPIPILLMKAGIEFPSKFKADLIKDLTNLTEKIESRLKNRIQTLYYQNPNEINEAYVWVKTIKCPNPKCNLEVPLAPNWELNTKKKNNRKISIYGIDPSIPEDLNTTEISINIIKNQPTSIINKKSIIKKGRGECPRCKNPLTPEYIKTEAFNGRMGHKLLAIVYREKIGSKLSEKKYRRPKIEDIKSLQVAEKELQKKKQDWLKNDILINETRSKGFSDRCFIYGVDNWSKFFNSRQILVNTIILEEIINLKSQLEENYNLSEQKILITYLQLGLNKILDYNSIQTRWNPLRNGIANSFSRHDFSFKWSYAEIDIRKQGLSWAMKKIIDSLEKIIKLFNNNKSGKITISNLNASNLENLTNNSVDLVVVDPPYYDNVMYAELSDFFYVWTKRSLGNLFPELFSSILTDKDNEAVANPSRFEGMGGSKRKLANQDYEAKMELIFREINRVLQKEGVLTIMFTHKSTEAWDTLAMSLLNSGFEITSTWSVHTEGENSFHIANKNAVKSTILLVCRKRKQQSENYWWEDDVLPSIKKVVEKKSKEFRKLGVEGVDLFISCFGPALKEYSKGYPVKNIAGDIVRAEEALEAARKVVIDITLQDIIKGKSFNIDSVSKFYLIAWQFFRARTFPFDEAHRLALSIGINIDELKTSYKLLNKKSGDVELFLPKDREKNGVISVDNPKDNGILINAVHIAILAYEEGGQKLFDSVVEKLRRNTDKSFRLYMEILFNILPNVKDLSKNLPEKKILGEILMVTEEKITPKGGKITDFLDK